MDDEALNHHLERVAQRVGSDLRGVSKGSPVRLHFPSHKLKCACFSLLDEVEHWKHPRLK